MDGFSLPTDSFSLLPEEMVSSLAATFTLISVVSLIGFVLFIILYLITAIRRWKVESATLAMHKDIQAIRTLLESHPLPSPATLQDTSQSLPSSHDTTTTTP